MKYAHMISTTLQLSSRPRLLARLRAPLDLPSYSGNTSRDGKSETSFVGTGGVLGPDLLCKLEDLINFQKRPKEPLLKAMQNVTKRRTEIISSTVGTLYASQVSDWGLSFSFFEAPFLLPLPSFSFSASSRSPLVKPFLRRFSVALASSPIDRR